MKNDQILILCCNLSERDLFTRLILRKQNRNISARYRQHCGVLRKEKTWRGNEFYPEFSLKLEVLAPLAPPPSLSINWELGLALENSLGLELLSQNKLGFCNWPQFVNNWLLVCYYKNIINWELGFELNINWELGLNTFPPSHYRPF